MRLRRLRILFALVAVALAVPTSLLLLRALGALELERRMRHETVAERLFDEMERALSVVLSREEERPFGQYGFTYAPPGALAGDLVRSPLSEAPGTPFIVGYFQIDPNGSLHTPLGPRDGEQGASTWQPSPDATAAITEIRRTVGRYWPPTTGASGSRATGTQLPGSTVTLGDEKAGKLEAKRDPDAKQQVSAFDALRSLNKGVEQRLDRQTKVSREYPNAAAQSASASSDDSRRGGAALEANAERSALPRHRANEISSFELSPMVGRGFDGRRLVLYRTVVHETQGYRQGLVIDVEKLGDWLRDRALGSTDLAPYATLSFGSATPSARPASGFTYQHRFAEPFEDLSARLVLASLPGGGAGASVYALAALLALAAVAGLAALYRMVAVGLRFAEQRSQFVAAVTHELKTPLTAIRMYGEMLRDGMVSSEAKRDEYHRHITAESERLTRLVNNVLEFSRLEKSPRAAALTTAPLAPVVREVAELARPHAESRGFSLAVDVEPDLPPVGFERDALLQVLFNLVDNAVKYADGHPPQEIAIRAARAGGAVRLAVRDHGPGVPARELEKIFEPFHRVEGESTRAGKGTGLGLALVRGLVERMGGRVVGRNVPDGGFEVEILLPVAAAS